MSPQALSYPWPTSIWQGVVHGDGFPNSFILKLGLGPASTQSF